MHVCEAQHGMAVAPNRVYTIPPNTKMVLVEGILQLSPRKKVFGKYMPGDALFTSLADECGHRAIAVVLSGGDGDGSLGLTAIKDAGGVTFAQCQATANVDSMPTSAIATGNVDFVLPPEKIAEELLNLSRNPMFVCPQPLVATDGSSFHKGYATEQQVDLEKICSLLLATTGIDFSYYKSKTLNRRIQRRMLLCRVEQLADYVVYLQAHPAEINALYAEILIHVTSFFRDPAAFELLKTRVFPTITQNKSAECPIRIWVAGCSTGEEVYSIAMCLLEFLADRVTLPSIQILATDISEPSLDKARAGIYNENQMVDVSPERRRRFFKQHISSSGSNAGSRYQIDRAVRGLCVFTRQDLGSDAAGANFDLISCRNVLIYFNESLQHRIMPIFYERLNSTGLLFLGMSESTGTSSNLFTVVERKHQIYAKNSTATQSTCSGTPSSDALPEPLRERTLGSRSHLNNLANRQSSLGALPGCDLQEQVERDLQAANEKILWIEQELQTKHEELKTAKEELQATTEELQTLAAELHYRNAQLDRVNNDLTVGVASSLLGQTLRERNETLLLKQTKGERVANAFALRLRNENRTQDDFLSNLSHELRNPLTAIIGWAQLLQTQYGSVKGWKQVKWLLPSARFRLKMQLKELSLYLTSQIVQKMLGYLAIQVVGLIMVRVIEYTIENDGEPVVYRLITSLLDPVAFPALVLAIEYRKRWEVESTIDELKVHLLGCKTLIRSLNPREVQEIYGWLLGHWAVRSLMFQVAEQADISPLRLSFTETLNVVRRAVPKFQRLELTEIPFFWAGYTQRLLGGWPA